MAAQYVIVNGDDWEGIYVNGFLVSEGHSHQTSELFKIIKQYGPVEAFWEIEPDMDWLMDHGSLPLSLFEVKLLKNSEFPDGIRFG